MLNLKLVERQPRWRVATVARFAKLMGVLIHVEGYPFGSSRRARLEETEKALGEAATNSAGAAG